MNPKSTKLPDELFDEGLIDLDVEQELHDLEMASKTDEDLDAMVAVLVAEHRKKKAQRSSEVEPETEADAERLGALRVAKYRHQNAQMLGLKPRSQALPASEDSPDPTRDL